MLTPLEKYFDGHILVINLDRREDRWRQAQALLAEFGITTATRVSAVDRPLCGGVPSATYGCNRSHVKVLDLILQQRWERALVLEDDFDILHEDFQAKFAQMAREVDAVAPEWDMLYLGGGYGGPPIARLTPHVIRCGAMFTASSFGISQAMARYLRPYLFADTAAPDAIYAPHLSGRLSLIVQPRLMVQTTNRSDLQGIDAADSSVSMLDSAHERMV